MKKAFIRADASVQIGTGHIMRCLTLALDLIKQGMEVFFICRDLPGNMVDYIRNKGYQALLLIPPEIKADDNHFQWLIENWLKDAEETKQLILQNKKEADQVLLVVDHYAFDKKWEQILRPWVNEIRVIDDLANRVHDCDLLLDQNYYQDMEKRYLGLVPPGCQLLLGPKYALLRPEFYEVKVNLRQRDGEVRRILVFFGGSDPTNETTKALEAIRILNNPDIAIDVVVGASNPQKNHIQRLCKSLPRANYYCQVDNMAMLMAEADLAIGGGGTATWERCFLGLPTLVMTVAENQVETIEDLAKMGAVWYLGWHRDVSVETIRKKIKEYQNSPVALMELSKNSLLLFY